VVGYDCRKVQGGVGVAGPGQREQRLDPNKCPAPPLAPPGANIDENIREILDDIQSSPYGGIAVAQGYFIAHVAGGSTWDYKSGGHREYDRFGNFNFGATGLAAGYSANDLARASGWVAERDDAGRSGHPSILRLWFGTPYPESAYDRGNYSAGMQYFRNECYKRKGT